ncbi:MAG: hypothetical protein AAF646_02940 [Pseudomonadota bacterium]
MNPKAKAILTAKIDRIALLTLRGEIAKRSGLLEISADAAAEIQRLQIELNKTFQGENIR